MKQNRLVYFGQTTWEAYFFCAVICSIAEKYVLCGWKIVFSAPRRGNEYIAQGIALGSLWRWSSPCKGKSDYGGHRPRWRWQAADSAFALSGRWPYMILTQGDALGYFRVGLSGRLQPHSTYFYALIIWHYQFLSLTLWPQIANINRKH